MNENGKGAFLYCFGGIILSLFLAAGLIHTLLFASEGNAGEKNRTQKEEGRKDDGEKKESGSVGKEKKSDPGKETQIRVLLKTNGFSQEVHASVACLAESGLTVSWEGGKKETKPGEGITVRPDDAMFEKGTVRIQPKEAGEKITVSSLKRGYGAPSYRGMLELYKTAQGIAVVNQLPLEEYLYGVVPSEMPASYEEEALKTQAVCARSYAYCHMEKEAYPEYKAHVDDSTAYQVYGNSKEQDKTIKAVNATKGEKLKYNGKTVKAYYFSTSCGKTTSVEAWGTKINKDNAYLKGGDIAENGECYEKNLPWFSWGCEIPVTLLSDLFGLNTGKDIGTVQNIEITKRGPGGVAVEMKAAGDKGEYTVKTENKIRSALAGNGYEIIKQDGSKTTASKLLPSAFFEIEKKGDRFHIKGGGYGHGIGMSQNGANEMAKKGKDYKTILGLFYQGVEITAD